MKGRGCRILCFVFLSLAFALGVSDANGQALVSTIPIGGVPSEIAITPDGSIALIVNETRDFVTVIDVASQSVVGTIPVGRQPVGVAITPDGGTALVTNEEGEEISVVDIARRAVAATISFSGRPDIVGISPNGRVALVTGDVGNRMTVIDLASLLVVATVPFPGGPEGIAFSPDGATAVVADELAGLLALVDLGTFSIVETVHLGGTPGFVALTPNGSTALVTNESTGEVIFLDVASRSVLGTIRPGGVPDTVAIAPDGMTALVTNEEWRNVSVIDITSRAVVGTIPLRGLPAFVAITPDGRTALVSSMERGEVSVIDLTAPPSSAELPSEILCVATPFSLDLGIGEVGTITVAVTSADLTPITDARIEFSSDAPQIGTVSPSSAAANEQGQAQVTVAAGALGVAIITVNCATPRGSETSEVAVQVVGEGEPRTRTIIPLISRTGAFETFISLQNPNDEAVTVHLSLRDGAGNLVDLAPGEEMQALPAHGNALAAVSSLLPPGSDFQIGWLSLDFGDREGNGLALLLQTQTFSMTAIPAVDAPDADTSLSITEFRARSNFTGQLFITNPFDQTASVDISVFERDGSPAGAESAIFSVGGVRRAASLSGISLAPGQLLDALTDDIAAEGANVGSIGISSTTPILAGELFFIPEVVTGNPLAMVFFPAQAIRAQGELDRIAVVPLISRAGAFTTFINLQNPNSTLVTARLDLFDSAGNAVPLALGASRQTLESHGNLLVPIDTLLPDDSEFRVGWLRIAFDSPANGLALILQTSTFSMTAVPALAERGAGRSLSITEFRARSNFTGQLFVTNPLDVAATLDINVWGRDGRPATASPATFLASGTEQTGSLDAISLPAGHQLEALTDDIAAPGTDAGSISINSTVPVMAGELFFIPELTTGNPLAMVFFPAQRVVAAPSVTPAPTRPPQPTPVPIPEVILLSEVQDRVFTSFCIACHRGAFAPLGLDLSDGQSAANLVDVPSLEVPTLNRVTPGDVENSYLWLKVIEDSSRRIGGRMPQGGPPLSPELIDLIGQWINGGALIQPP